jgi:hypothetical protein
VLTVDENVSEYHGWNYINPEIQLLNYEVSAEFPQFF